MNRNRLRALEKFKGKCPVTCTTFSSRGDLLFYAMSYDWSKGAENNNTSVSEYFYYSYICLYIMMNYDKLYYSMVIIFMLIHY